MVCPDSLGLLGTKRRCGICLCVCIISDFLVLGIYWSRIGDALKNPFIAISESLQSDHEFVEAINLSQHLNASAQTIKTNTTDYWDENNRPGVGRMIYHFCATLLYLGYTSVNVVILLNTIIKVLYSYGVALINVCICNTNITLLDNVIYSIHFALVTI